MSTVTLAMDDAGFIVGSYVLTFAVIGTLALAFVRRGRRLADSVDDRDKYWT